MGENFNSLFLFTQTFVTIHFVTGVDKYTLALVGIPIVGDLAAHPPQKSTTINRVSEIKHC